MNIESELKDTRFSVYIIRRHYTHDARDHMAIAENTLVFAHKSIDHTVAVVQEGPLLELAQNIKIVSAHCISGIFNAVRRPAV